MLMMMMTFLVIPLLKGDLSNNLHQDDDDDDGCLGCLGFANEFLKVKQSGLKEIIYPVSFF